MNSIFTITTIEKLTPMHNSRCVGWFEIELDAREIVENNYGVQDPFCLESDQNS